MEGDLDPIAKLERLEATKRLIIKEAIDDTLPSLAVGDIREATMFALSTLDDIRQGHNPQYEPLLRAKAQELGIDLAA